MQLLKSEQTGCSLLLSIRNMYKFGCYGNRHLINADVDLQDGLCICCLHLASDVFWLHNVFLNRKHFIVL